MISEEDKNLLLIDLCGRLPYGVKFKTTSTNTTTLKSIGIGSLGLIPINLFYKKPEFYLINEFGNLEFKPYLRPMTSMTEEEKEEYNSFIGQTGCYILSMDFCHKHHLDNRGLIKKGLAIAVTKEDNPYKEDVR